MKKDIPRKPHDWFVHPIQRGNGSKVCFCGIPLEKGRYGWYPHDGGVTIEKEVEG